MSNTKLTPTVNIEKRKNIITLLLASFSAFIFLSGLNKFNLDFLEPKQGLAKGGYGSTPYGG